MTSPPHKEPLVVEWGAASAPLEGVESGDLEVVAPFPGGAVVAAIDGLGHGHEAAAAARDAASVIEAHAADHVVDLLERCHVALRGTRGAVMTLAAFDGRCATMTWVGVGNVEAALFHAHPMATPARDDLLTRGGVVGYQMPPLRARTLAVAPGDTLLMGTDGLRSGFSAGPMPAGTPQEIAERILRSHAKGTDDVLVVVARYRGGPDG